jgi:HD-GYP domain-containing protein (c-di-GMP phosphodiesterase class II)
VRIRDLLEHAHLSYLQAITTLGHALQARDPDAAGRTERVSQLSRIIGAAMEMPEADQHALTIGVVVHDIGRVCLRPREKPTMVPQLSAQILDPLDLPLIVKQMAHHHLERFDGLGGPDGLRGDDIPLAARIVAVADALDDLTTQTAAHAALPLQHALAELREEEGSRFCPEVLAALHRSLAGDPTLRRYFGERPGDGLPRVA